MPDVSQSRWWDRQLESNLPDCRVRYEDRRIVMHGPLAMEEVYCAQCHKARGLVTAGNPHVFLICDDCYFKTGETTPPGCLKIGD